MKRTVKILVAIVTLLITGGCVDTPDNPNAPQVIIDFTIYPNSTHYHDLNVVSGWMYVTSETPSRGIIIYRMSQDEFKAYDRIPPNDPDACCDDEGNCTRLVVDSPFVVDNCNGIQYSILDGSIFSGDGVYPLIEYHTVYDGNSLRVYN